MGKRYRSKDFVLDTRHLNPILGDALENKGGMLQVRHGHTGSRLTYPCELIIEGLYLEKEHVLEKKASGLAGSTLSIMDGRDAWIGTASELLALIGPNVEDLPKDAIRPSTVVLRPHVVNVLETEGILVQKRRTMNNGPLGPWAQVVEH